MVGKGLQQLRTKHGKTWLKKWGPTNIQEVSVGSLSRTLTAPHTPSSTLLPFRSFKTRSHLTQRRFIHRQTARLASRVHSVAFPPKPGMRAGAHSTSLERHAGVAKPLGTREEEAGYLHCKPWLLQTQGKGVIRIPRAWDLKLKGTHSPQTTDKQQRRLQKSPDMFTLKPI